MAYFAELNSDNIVLRVISVADKDTADGDGNEVESIGITFCKSLCGSDTNWIQTSYNNNMRVRYAGIGYKYHSDRNAFIPAQPFPSWVINNTTIDWESPIAEPTLTDAEIADNKYYSWNESLYQSDNTQGWVLITS